MGFLFKYSLLGQQAWKFVVSFSKKLSRLGDGKQNILFGFRAFDFSYYQFHYNFWTIFDFERIPTNLGPGVLLRGGQLFGGVSKIVICLAF